MERSSDREGDNRVESSEDSDEEESGEMMAQDPMEIAEGVKRQISAKEEKPESTNMGSGITAAPQSIRSALPLIR